MHQTNDDGPPSAQASPYILPFVQHLEAAGHTVSVIVPDSQRSWIGKAHIVGQDVQTTPYWPPESTPDVHAGGADVKEGKEPWVLVNSTPATCAQIGISHFFNEKGPIELVVSGPNYGRYVYFLLLLSRSSIRTRSCHVYALNRSAILVLAAQSWLLALQLTY